MYNSTLVAPEKRTYHYTRKVKKSFDEIVRKVTSNLQDNGFDIVTNIDIKNTLKKKLGINFRKYKILGACHPEFAYQLITLESHIGLLLPTHILIQEHENGEVELSAVNPLEHVDEQLNIDITWIIQEISNRLQVAIDEAI